MLSPQAKAAAVLKGPDGRSVSKLLLDGGTIWRIRADTQASELASQANGVRGVFQLPKFSVIIWVRKTDEFEAIRNDLISLVGDEPFETTEYEGMVDFHWGAEEHAKAKQIADSLREISKRSEIVLLRVSSLDDATASFSVKDERRTRH